MLSVYVGEAPIFAERELSRFMGSVENSGGVALFIGRMRGISGGREIRALHIEHYAGMCEKEIYKIGADAMRRFDLEALGVWHRVGRILPGEVIALVVAASEHRKTSFRAVERVMDFLKTRAPFWKREESAEGIAWVEARDEDRAAEASWDSS